MENLLRNMVDSLWLSATWVERLRSELGLLGMHQVWGERPAWYVWLADSPGVHCLEFLHAEQEQGMVRGLFGLKFYPAKSRELWAGLSPQERGWASGKSFDQSGTPCFEQREQIPPHLFQVGALELALDFDRAWCYFGLSALGQCRRLNARGGLVRNLPGWDLSHQLFDRLLGLYAFGSRQTPVLAVFALGPGLEVAESADGREQARECGQTRAYNLGLLFGPDPGRPPLGPAAWQNLAPAAGPGGQAWERAFSCHHYHPWEAAAEGRPVLRPQWWSLARAGYTSHLASACGCEH